MTYSISRKINLAGIDRDLFAFETEDISVDGADSFEEAKTTLDRAVAERVAYYRGISDAEKAKSPAPQTTGGAARGVSRVVPRPSETSGEPHYVGQGDPFRD